MESFDVIVIFPISYDAKNNIKKHVLKWKTYVSTYNWVRMIFDVVGGKSVYDIYCT